MAVKKEGITYEEIVRDIRKREFKPIYFLMGEEAFYIDRIADLLASSVLSEEEQGFDQVTLYGVDTTVGAIVNSARSYPMLAKHQLIIVREAQKLERIEELAHYAQNPLLSTILVVCYKNAILDRRKKLASLVQKSGVLFESKRLYDNQVPSFITTYVKNRSLLIDPNATQLLADHIGCDLSRIVSELDKLTITMPRGERQITTDLIARNIGISKEFNDFELVSALADRNIYKANLIAKYFYSNQKANPIQKSLTVLFNYYSSLMLAFYAPEKSEHGIAEWLDMQVWQVRKNILPGMKNYSGVKVLQIIDKLRRVDAQSKGIDNVSLASDDLLKELIFYILH